MLYHWHNIGRDSVTLLITLGTNKNKKKRIEISTATLNYPVKIKMRCSFVLFTGFESFRQLQNARHCRFLFLVKLVVLEVVYLFLGIGSKIVVVPGYCSYQTRFLPLVFTEVFACTVQVKRSFSLLARFKLGSITRYAVPRINLRNKYTTLKVGSQK